MRPCSWRQPLLVALLTGPAAAVRDTRLDLRDGLGSEAFLVGGDFRTSPAGRGNSTAAALADLGGVADERAAARAQEGGSADDAEAACVGLCLVQGGFKGFLLDHLTGVGATPETIQKVVTQAAEVALAGSEEPLLAGLSEEEAGEKRGAVTRVPWTPEEWLRHINATCGSSMVPKGLGAASSSSRSGAKFWNCASPPDTAPMRRMLVKGGLRSSRASPEWQLFQKITADLTSPYSRTPSTLNKMLLGFDAFQLHWLVLEDLRASPLIAKLDALGVKFGPKKPEWSAYDIKPVDSRSPQMPDCVLKLKQVVRAMGPLKDFVGWARLREALRLDLDFLDSHSIMDESLFFQVAGPFPVDGKTVKAVGETQILGVLSGTPVCAYQVSGESMAIVCVSVLDYVLSMNFWKSVQNALQGSRWDRYGEKLLTMFDCLGDEAGDKCADYRKVAAGRWIEVVEARYKEAAKVQSFATAVANLEKRYRCCCSVESKRSKLTMETSCAWRKIPEEVDRRGKCGSQNGHHFALSRGGCWDVEPPEVPPPEPQSTCSGLNACCCDDSAYPLGLPREKAAELCGCHLVCGRHKHRYNGKAYCPKAYSPLESDALGMGR